MPQAFCKASILIKSIVSIAEGGYGWDRIAILPIRPRLNLQAEHDYQPEKHAAAEIRETASFDFIQFLILEFFHLSFSRLNLPGRKRFTYRT